MDAKAVGQRIKAAREKKNLTQEDLAALVEISPTHVSVIERGTKIPRMDTFVAIANVLEVSADSLLVDVVDHATEGVASELSAAIDNLPHDEKMRILKVLTNAGSVGSRRRLRISYRPMKQFATTVCASSLPTAKQCSQVCAARSSTRFFLKDQR